MMDDKDDAENLRKKKTDEGSEGDSDSWGRGKAGSGAGIGKVIRLSPEKLKEVMAAWRRLDMGAAVEAVAEFFSEMPTRASANLSVVWKQTKTNARSFAVVNWVISFGEKAAAELRMQRERARGAGRGRDTRGYQNRREKKIRSPGMTMGPHPSQQ